MASAQKEANCAVWFARVSTGIMDSALCESQTSDTPTPEPTTKTATMPTTSRVPRIYQNAGNFAEFSGMLAPIAYNNWKLGKHISTTQADVEVLGITLKDVPLCPEQFDIMSQGRDWVSMSMCILGVGPPGFSNVPYTQAKKNGILKVPTQGLYDLDLHGRTRFHTFEKGQTNKDKGVRVSDITVEGMDEIQDATTVLEAGTSLSVFLRADNFATDNKMWFMDKTTQVLPAFSIVLMQFASANVEQARKGQGLKLRKIKEVSCQDLALMSIFNGLPTSELLYEEVMERSRKCISIDKMLFSGNMKLFASRPDKIAYATKDQDIEGGFVLCNIDSNTPEVVFSAAQLQSLFGVSQQMDALKLMNIAIAMNALRLLVVRDDRPTIGDPKPAVSVASMAIDWNEMMHMHIVAGMMEWPCMHESWTLPCVEQASLQTTVTAKGTVLWCNPAKPLRVASESRIVVFVMRMKADQALDAEQECRHFVTDEDERQGGHLLEIYLTKIDNIGQVQDLLFDESGEQNMHENEVMKRVASLRFKPERKGATGQKKRKEMDWFI